jgi:hypothetical protein
MRYAKLVLLFVMCLPATLIAQDKDDLSIQEKDWPDMAKSVQIKIEDSHNEMEKLQIRLLKATNDELRHRYTFWLQGIGNIDGLINAIDRYHNARIDVNPTANVDALLAEKLDLAIRIEKQAKILSEEKRGAEHASAPIATYAYRISVDLDIAKRKMQEKDAKKDR